MSLDAMEMYKSYLQIQPMSIHTRRNYLQRVNGFLNWLDASFDGAPTLIDPNEVHSQLRDYKAFLQARGASASTINGVLSAVDNFSKSRGIESARVKRLELPLLIDEALDIDEEKRLIKSLLRNTLRNRALVLLLWHCGLRISEAASLNVADVNLSSDKCQIRVHRGKRAKERMVPSTAQLKHCLQLYISKQKCLSDNEPLFVSQKGRRLSIASIDRIVRQIGQIANVELSAGRLRYDFVNRLIRAKINIVMVAELCGHAKLESVRRYSQMERALSCNLETQTGDGRE